MSDENKKQMTIAIWTEIILKAFYFQTTENFKNLCAQMFQIIGQEDVNQVLTTCDNLAKKEREFV
ncbi:hypothetical protein DSECCO2_501900 [anaerobic digester metagenome]